MKKRNLICLLLAGISAFGLVSCGKKGGNSNDNKKPQDPPTEYLADKDEHKVEGTLHEFKVTDNANRKFVENGSTAYTVYYDTENSYAKDAFSLITTQVKYATGAVLDGKPLSAEFENNWTPDKKCIILNGQDAFEKSGLTAPTVNLGESGCFVKTVGNTVFIMSQNVLGYQVGAIKFLEATLGYDMLSMDCTIYEKSGETIPDMDIVEKPDFDFRVVTNKANKKVNYAMGFNALYLNDVFIPVPERNAKNATMDDYVKATNGIPVHNSFNFLPPTMYASEHPDWFYHPDDRNTQQLCYTAHGNAEEYEAMVQELYVWLKLAVDANPNLSNITITHQDNRAACDCDTCSKIVEDYGTITAAYIMFLNDVDTLLQADLEEEAKENGTEKRDVNILFFAYHATKDAPVKENDKGEFVPVDDKVIMHDHVGVFVATIESYYVSSFYEDLNEKMGEARQFRAWSCLTNCVYAWHYETHFNIYFYPYSTWDSIIETYRYSIANNAVFIYNEGQLNQTNPTCFSIFKEYIDSKAELDVNLNYSDIEQKFFKYYFKDAQEPMYKFFKELQTYLADLTAHNSEASGRVYDALNKKEYWSYRTIQSWLGYIKEAYAAIEKYRTADPETYTMLHDHIMIESLFPRYVLIDLYAGNYSEKELSERRKAFIDDNTYLHNTQQAESTKLSDLYKSWGF